MSSGRKSGIRPKETWKVFTLEASAFAAVFALAVIQVAKTPVVDRIPVTSTGGMLWYFLTTFVVMTLLLLLLLRTVKGVKLFTVIFAVAVFTGVAAFTHQVFGASAAILMTSACVLLYYSLRIVAVFDAILVVGMAGIAAYLGGSFNAVAIVIILAILAVYDIIAVYGTKHMVEMSERLLQRKAMFAIIIPVELRGFLARVEKIGSGQGFLFLGTGDIVLPALLVSASAKVGLFSAVATGVGAISGLALTNFIFVHYAKKRPMPALPPIASGAILGHLFTYLL